MFAWLLGSRCRCTPKLAARRHDQWNAGTLFYGYALVVVVRAHTGHCPLADEVLTVRGVKIR